MRSMSPFYRLPGLRDLQCAMYFMIILLRLWALAGLNTQLALLAREASPRPGEQARKPETGQELNKITG